MNELHLPPAGTASAKKPCPRTKKIVRAGYFTLLTAVGVCLFYAFAPSFRSGNSAVLKAHPGKELRKKFAFRRRELAAQERRFERELDQNLAAGVVRLYAGADAAAAELSSFGFGMKLCCQLAADKIRRTDSARKTLRAAIRKQILIPGAELQRRAEAVLSDYILQVRVSDARFRSELAEGLDKIRLPATQRRALRRLGAAMTESEDHAAGLAFGQLSTASGVVLETLFIRSTMRLLAAVMAKSAVRLTGTFSAGAASAVADGPLPVGDAIGAAIAAGGLGWTAYDIYTVRRILPEKLRAHLRSAADRYKTGLKSETLDRGKNVTARMKESLRACERAIESKLEKPQ